MIALRPRPVWFLGGLAASAAVFAWMVSVAPGNVAAVQFAFTGERAYAILSDLDWQATAATLRRDNVFLCVYWLPNIVATLWAADRYRAARRVRPATARWAVVAVALAVSVLDAVENALTLEMVWAVRDSLGGVEGWLAAVTSAVAVLKWLCLAVVLAYVLRAVVLRVRP